MIEGDGSVSIAIAIGLLIIAALFAATYAALSLESSTSAIKSVIAFAGAATGFGFIWMWRDDTSVSTASAVLIGSGICAVPCVPLHRIASIAARRGSKYRPVVCHIAALTTLLSTLVVYEPTVRHWNLLEVIVSVVFCLVGWGVGFAAFALFQSALTEMRILRLGRRLRTAADKC
jgi:hypothetical protein